MAHAPQAAWMEVVHKPRSLVNAQGVMQPVEVLQGQPVAAFAGIGNPQGFYHSLQQLDYRVVARREFPDHHHYTRDDMVALQRWLSEQSAVAAVICTCKDLVKISATQIGDRPLWGLSIDVEIVQGQDQLESLLENVRVAKPG